MVQKYSTENWQNMVADLAKPGHLILEELTPEDCHLWHMASALNGEAGELFDAIKKAVVYRKPLDGMNVVEELGDMEFYMEGLRAMLGITREHTLQANYVKLEKRYKNFQYTDMAAQHRNDKKT